MNAQRSLILLLSCLLLIAMPSQATEPTGTCGTGSEGAEERHEAGEEDGAPDDPAGPSEPNGTAEEEASDDEDIVCAAMAAVCALVGITNHNEVNIDPDGCIWSKVDRIVNGADGSSGIEGSGGHSTY